MKNTKKIILSLAILLLIFILWQFDLSQYLSLNRISELKLFINDFGILAPIVFASLYIISTVFFLPALPLTLLAGVIFGPLVSSILVSISSIIGATLAFIVGRYIGRDYIVTRFSKSKLFNSLDSGVKDQGWKMVAITRLVPLFPFNAQNYVYGLTDIALRTYVLVSWICMLPATIAYTFLAGSILSGDGNVSKTITYVSIGLGLILALSIVSKIIIKKQNIKKES